MENRVNTRPSRAKAKYGAVNGVYATFFFSAMELKVLHKSAVAFEELRLIPQKNAAVRKKAGESRGVALLPLGGSQRTATPTAGGFVRYFEVAYKTTV